MRSPVSRLALLALIGAACPALAEPFNGTLLDRTVAIDIPAPFGASPAFSNTADGAAIHEFLPAGESLEAWSELLTLTALGGVAAGMTPQQAAEAMAGNLANGYAAACPDGFAAQDLGAPAVPGAEAVLAGWLGCNDVGGSGQSEAMVVLIAVAGGSVYTAQWAEHVPAMQGPPVFDMAHWMPRLDGLMTLNLAP